MENSQLCINIYRAAAPKFTAMIKFLLSFLSLCVFSASAQVPTIEPDVLYPIPDIDYVELERLLDLLDNVGWDSMSRDEQELLFLTEDDPVLSHFYSYACSWYCGGEIRSVTASSSLSERYKASNAHDFNINTAWVEGVAGYGEGESLLYTFPGTCSCITRVLILNGYTKNESVWRNNARVKRPLMYYNDQPYAILNLKDRRDCQQFEIGLLGYEDKEKAPAWSIKFEILEVYPGDKYEDTVISEIYFDGIHVH